MYKYLSGFFVFWASLNLLRLDKSTFADAAACEVK